MFERIYITLANGNNNSFRKPITKTVVLNIDEDAAGNNIEVKWIGEVKPEFEAVKELENNLDQIDGLRCANIHMDGKKYLVRFGKQWCNYGKGLSLVAIAKTMEMEAYLKTTDSSILEHTRDPTIVWNILLGSLG